MRRVVFSAATMLGLAILAMALTPAPARANAILDFGTGLAGSGGTLTISGGDAVGVGIPIGSLIVAGAPQGNNSVGWITNAILSFNTITNTISIDGTIAGLGINSTVNLLTGSFSSFSITSNGFVGSITGSGSDIKGSELMSALGLPANTQWQLFGFSLGIDISGGGGYTVTSTDITNTQTPEPGTMLMFGTGLISLGGLLRRKLRA
jgi:hypothetical protein